MPREIKTHFCPGFNEAIKVLALDESGPGGACHSYEIFADGQKATIQPGTSVNTRICFQKGGIVEAGGVNGISNEALLAIVRDRLEGFQSGPFACPENQEALEHVISAMEVLQARTAARVNRGVEGTSTV